MEVLRRSMPKLDHSHLIPEGARSLRVQTCVRFSEQNCPPRRFRAIFPTSGPLEKGSRKRPGGTPPSSRVQAQACTPRDAAPPGFACLVL